MEDFCGFSGVTSDQHVDQRDSRVLLYNEDEQKLGNWLELYDPILDRSELMSVFTGVVVDDRINCHRTIEVGQAMISKMVGLNFQVVDFQRKKKVLHFSALSSSIEIEKCPVPGNSMILFKRMRILKESSGDMHKYFDYELAPFPMSLFF